jgi:hypothetical protein
MLDVDRSTAAGLSHIGGMYPHHSHYAGRGGGGLFSRCCFLFSDTEDGVDLWSYTEQSTQKEVGLKLKDSRPKVETMACMV